MAKVLVLGGSGAVGSVAAGALAAHDLFEQVIIGDLNIPGAEAVAAGAPEGKVSVLSVDASDQQAVREAARGCDVVLNCVGPFYKTVKTVLAAVIAEKIDYVDVCDDVDVTLELFEGMDREAEAAGIRALIGMGSSPGATNLLAKFAADTLLDSVEAVDIFHAHGGEPVEGAGVIGHRFHCMSIPIPMFLDGELKYVSYFEEDGIALRQPFTFPVIGEGQLYPYPHPEQVTLPRYIELKQVTNKGTVLPGEYYDLTRDMCQLGLASTDPVKVGDHEVEPYDFAIGYILRERERILKETDFGTQRGCCSVVVLGTKDDKPEEYRFHMASSNQALGEGTGLPAAVGTILMAKGKIDKLGAYPPEAAVPPLEFIGLIPQVMKLDREGKTGGFGGVLVERIDAEGKVHTFNL